MKPTKHLRFVRRQFLFSDNATTYSFHLQQWWSTSGDDTDFIVKANGEWRDVPTEEELQ